MHSAPQPGAPHRCSSGSLPAAATVFALGESQGLQVACTCNPGQRGAACRSAFAPAMSVKGNMTTFRPSSKPASPSSSVRHLLGSCGRQQTAPSPHPAGHLRRCSSTWGQGLGTGEATSRDWWTTSVGGHMMGWCPSSASSRRSAGFPLAGIWDAISCLP